MSASSSSGRPAGTAVAVWTRLHSSSFLPPRAIRRMWRRRARVVRSDDGHPVEQGECGRGNATRVRAAGGTHRGFEQYRGTRRRRWRWRWRCRFGLMQMQMQMQVQVHPPFPPRRGSNLGRVGQNSRSISAELSERLSVGLCNSATLVGGGVRLVAAVGGAATAGWCSNGWWCSCRGCSGGSTGRCSCPRKSARAGATRRTATARGGGPAPAVTEARWYGWPREVGPVGATADGAHQSSAQAGR